MSSADNSGLGLFDDAASAAGSFPTALRGYERSAVDAYVRSLEAHVVASRRQAQDLAGQLNRAQTVAAAPPEPPEVDYSDLGGRASDILRLAQEQARDLTDQAAAEAERTREVARREADGIRRDATRQGAELQIDGAARIDQLRGRLHEDVEAQVEHARVDAQALVDAARRQAEALQHQSEHEVQVVRQAADLDIENLRRTVQREAADARQEIAVAREQALAGLRSDHEDAQARTTALLDEATAFHAQSAARLETDIADAARIRAEALAESEATRVAAAREADGWIDAAQQEAIALRERTQQEFGWRKQQLRRETELLNQRKQAVLGQLASLSALAQQTSQTFPELDDLDEQPGAAEDWTDAGAPERQVEDPDLAETTIRPVVTPDRADDADADAETDAYADEEDPTQPGFAEPDQAPEQPASSTAVAEPPMDGDATILISLDDLPAGTEHLRRPGH